LARRALLTASVNDDVVRFDGAFDHLGIAFLRMFVLFT
jgi:hypothetical protein